MNLCNLPPGNQIRPIQFQTKNSSFQPQPHFIHYKNSESKDEAHSFHLFFSCVQVYQRQRFHAKQLHLTSARDEHNPCNF